jgi:hypothetical protein
MNKKQNLKQRKKMAEKNFPLGATFHLSLKTLKVFPPHFFQSMVNQIRVARRFVFKPKIQIWVNFGSTCNGRFWYILWPFGTFSDHVVYFIALWYILWSFGIFRPF